MLSRIFGMLREIVQLSKMGAGSISDAYTASLLLPGMIRKLTSEGLFNSSFIPIYQELKTTHDERTADIWACNMLWRIFLVCLIVLIFSQIFMQYILAIFNSGFLHKPNWALLNVLSHITFVSIIGSSLSSFLNTIWTAKKHFFLASIGSTICNASIIGLTLLSTDVYQIALSTTLGTYIQFFAILYPLRSHVYFEKTPHSLQTKKFIKLFIPLLVAAFLLQYLVVVSAWFGSWLQTGQLTYINKADKLMQLPISLIGTALSTVLIPMLLSRKHSGYTTLSAQAGIMLAGFFFSAIFILHQEISRLVFMYGKLTLKDTQQIGSLLFVYAFSIPAWILIKIWHASLASARDTKSTLVGNIIHLSVYAILGMYLIQHLTMHKLAVISVLSTWSNCIFLTYRIHKKQLIGKIWKFSLINLLCTIFFSYSGQLLVLSTNNILLKMFTTGIYLSCGYFLLYILLKKKTL